MEFKFIVFYATYLIGIPAAVLAGILFRPVNKLLVAVMCFSLCYPDRFSVNFVSREGYRMATRGFEFSLFDACTIALFLIMVLRPRGERFRWFPPLTLTYGLLILFALFSWMLTPGNLPVPSAALYLAEGRGSEFYSHFETSLYPLFEIVKMLRGAFAYLVVVNFLRKEEHFRALAAALLLAVLVISTEAILDRYLRGFHRISATLGHPNSLGTFMAMAGTFLFGITLSKPTFVPAGTFAIGTAAAFVSIILSISRGALAALVLGLWLDVTALFHRFLSLKNFFILFAGSLTVLALFYMAADTITARFLTEQDAIDDLHYRGLYNEEAKLMAQDRVFGVGLGNFSAYSWLGYAARVGLDSPGAPAHNLWYLVLGEMGWPGLIVFIAYWLRFYQLSIPFFFRLRSSFITAVATSAALSTLIGHVQNALQLSYRQTAMYMLNKILIGMAVAAWYVERDERRAARPPGKTLSHNQGKLR